MYRTFMLFLAEMGYKLAPFWAVGFLLLFCEMVHSKDRKRRLLYAFAAGICLLALIQIPLGAQMQ